MLSRTHGQPASPTTFGKECANYSHRLRNELEKLMGMRPSAKLSGATGNYNAQMVAYPKIDWELFSRRFIEGFGLANSEMATQLAPHDGISEILDCVKRINSICLDLSKNVWLYCMLGYLIIKKKEGEVGSSTMPHKVNPIDFENGEGNLELANTLLSFFSQRLQLSRLQRDLSDSTIKRNYGVAMSHSVLGVTSITRGLGKVSPNEEAIYKDLKEHEEVLSEAIQIILRRERVSDAYESVKRLSRGTKGIERLLKELEVPEKAFKEISSLRVEKYAGLASELAETEAGKTEIFIKVQKAKLKRR